MRIEFSNNAQKSLKKISQIDRNRIREKLFSLILFIEEFHYLPYKEYSIKKLKGNWSPKKRMRIGKIRIIFDVLEEYQLLRIYEIDYRGNIYD